MLETQRLKRLSSLVYNKNLSDILLSSTVVLKLYKHTEPLSSFLSFYQTSFLSNKAESKNGLLK